MKIFREYLNESTPGRTRVELTIEELKAVASLIGNLNKIKMRELGLTERQINILCGIYWFQPPKE